MKRNYICSKKNQASHLVQLHTNFTLLGDSQLLSVVIGYGVGVLISN